VGSRDEDTFPRGEEAVGVQIVVLAEHGDGDFVCQGERREGVVWADVVDCVVCFGGFGWGCVVIVGVGVGVSRQPR